MTRGQSIRTYCKGCTDGEENPRHCELTTCPLYRYRRGTEDKGVGGKRVPRSGAIRRFCRECVSGTNAAAVQNRCVSPDCILYEWRL